MLFNQETTEALDPRVRRTRQLLIQSMDALLAEKTLESITIGDIADRATVNRATFYAHFTDKYALFEHLIRETFRESLERSLSEAEEFCGDHLRLLVVAVCEYLAEFSGHCHPGDGQTFRLVIQQVQGQLYEIIYDWLQSQESGPEDVEVAAATVSWTIFGAAFHWSRQKSRLTADDLAAQVMDLMQGGFAAFVSGENDGLSDRVPAR